jgi:hypothetical protein
MDDPEEMGPVELRAIRGLIGFRLGYGGPMPQGKMAALLDISPRTVWSYEHGQTLIPRHVARRARELRDDQSLSWDRLPRRWKRQLDNTLARRAYYKRRKAKRDAEREAAKATKPPPF